MNSAEEPPIPEIPRADEFPHVLTAANDATFPPTPVLGEAREGPRPGTPEWRFGIGASDYQEALQRSQAETPDEVSARSCGTYAGQHPASPAAWRNSWYRPPELAR